MSEHRRVATTLLFILVATAGVGLAASLAWGEPLPLALALYLGMEAIVFVGLLLTPTAAPAEDTPAEDTPAEDTPSAAPPLARLHVLHWAQGLSGLIAALAGLSTGGPIPRLGDPPLIALGVGALTLGLGQVILARYYQATPEDALPEASGLASWFRAGAWLAALAGADLVLRGTGRPWLEGYANDAVYGACALLSAELLLRSLPTVFFLKKVARAPETYPGIRPALLVWLCSRFNPVASVFDSMERFFGVDLKSTWALTFIRRSLEPLTVGVLAAGWLSTALVMLNTDEQGVVERLGRPLAGEPLGPGLHLIGPWPIDRVVRASVLRIRTMPIGHESEAEDPSTWEPEDTLWARSHGGTEYTLLLGDGRDLISGDGVLHYRIKDLRSWLYDTQNPEELLRSIAYEALMQHTVHRTLDEALSENLQVVSGEILEHIRAELARLELGVEAVDFTLAALHPPQAVAVNYQSVVSAQIEKNSRVTEAQAYRVATLPAAETEALVAANQSKADGLTRRASATGEAQAFLSVEAAWRASPSLFRYRRRLEALERDLPGRQLVVIDHRLERDGVSLWLTE